MWQRLKCQATQFGDNKHKPDGRFSHIKERARNMKALVQASALKKVTNAPTT